MTQIRQLVIVRRDKLATYGLLAQAFADEPNVRLIWDRRVRERRRNSASSDPTDRRRRDRRGAPPTTWSSNDYLMANMAVGIAPDTAQTEALALPSTGKHGRDSKEIQRDIEAAVRSDLTVLISGGDVMSRNSLAHRIHERSNRHDRPLIVVDRDAFFGVSLSGLDLDNAAWAEWSNAGTILIEEVADLSWEQQSQLFHILERGGEGWDHRTNESRSARIISGTSHELLKRVASNQFRADLFYRLNVIHLVLPTDWVPTFD